MTIADHWPAAQVFAWSAWSIESDPWLNLERATPGYIAQDIEHATRNTEHGTR